MKVLGSVLACLVPLSAYAVEEDHIMQKAILIWQGQDQSVAGTKGWLRQIFKCLCLLSFSFEFASDAPEKTHWFASHSEGWICSSGWEERADDWSSPVFFQG